MENRFTAVIHSFALSQPLPNLENVVLIGSRHLTLRQKELLDWTGVTVFNIDDVDKMGIVGVMNTALSVAGQATRGIHVSLDMAVADGKEAPGVWAPEPGGLNYREVHLGMEMIADSRMLLSAEICGINPTNDIRGLTAKFAISLIASLLGRKVANG